MRRSALALAKVLLAGGVSLACNDPVAPEPVASVTISGADSPVETGGQLQLTAQPYDADGNEIEGRAVSWSTSDPIKATVDAAGLLSALTGGEVTVTASVDGVAGEAVVTVLARPVETVEVTPSPVTMGEFTTQQLTVTLRDQDGNPTTAPVVWSSTNGAVALVDQAGLLSGIAPGLANISATAGGKSGIALVTVVPYPVKSVELTPASGTVGVGLTLELGVVLRDSVGTVLTHRPVAWTSTDLSTAGVNSTGRVNGVAQGTVKVIAAANEVSDTSDLEVVVVPVASVTIVGETFDFVPGDRLSYDVVARDAVGNIFLPGSLGPVTWQTTDPAVLALDGGVGMPVTTGSVGDAALSATLAGATGTAPVTVRTLSFQSLSVGGRSRNPSFFGRSCGRTAAGATYCWVGLGDALITTSGGATPPRGVLGDFAFASISAGLTHRCGLTAAGVAHCWGEGADGRLGTGSTPDTTSIPTPVAGGLTFQAVSAGANHSCGVTTAGLAYCWGDNTYGQLGRGSDGGSGDPVPVAGGLQFTGISAGFVHTCAVATDGKAYCWGHNETGELGNGSTSNSNSPVLVAGGHTFQSVDAGGQRSFSRVDVEGFTCGVTNSGQGLCWGSNGTLGLGAGLSDLFRSTPVPVLGGLTYQSISTGSGHACGVASDGTAYCWGDNSADQVGHPGTSRNVPSLPGPVAGGLSWTSVEAGEVMTCGISTNGAGYCWGNHIEHFAHSSSTPLRIAGQP